MLAPLRLRRAGSVIVHYWREEGWTDCLIDPLQVEFDKARNDLIYWFPLDLGESRLYVPV